MRDFGGDLRDISGELQGRAERLKAEIGAEHARFQNLVLELRSKRDLDIEPLRAQLRLANKLLQFADWHETVRAQLAARIAAAEAAENSIRKSLGSG
jgi:hypothetical protein